MKNRAKCKLCEEILESFHEHDFVVCKCGEISIDGGMSCFKAYAKDWKNFLRVDDEGNEIIIKVVEEEDPKLGDQSELSVKPTKKELIEMLNAMAKNIENLPSNAMSLPINHYDFYSALLIIHSIVSSED